MQLLTKQIEKSLPELYATECEENPIAWVKFFTPWTHWTWYATEFDGEDRFFGLVVGEHTEFGYFLLSELLSVEGPCGLRVERDRYFEPTRVSKLL